MPKSVQQTELAIHQPFPEYGEVNYQAPQGNSSGGSSLWEMVDDRLRGRWRLMFIVGAVLAVACMAYGWMSGKIRYQSEGSIRIIPTLPHLIKKTDETRAMPHFEMFRTTQVHFLKSNRVLDHASKSPELQAATGTEVSPRGVLEGLKVRSDRESELIFLAVEADDPKSAQAALDAVIDAYTDIYGRAGSDDVSTKLKELTVYQDDLTRQKRLNRVEQQRILSRYAKLDLPELQADKHQEMDGFQDRLSTANFALSGASGNGGTVPWNTPVDGPQDLYLESVSPRLQQLRGMMDEARTHFAFVRERFKDGTAQYVRAEKRAETAQMLYEEEYGNAIKMAVQIADSLPVGELVDFRGLSAERVKEEISAISDELQATEIEAQRIATDIQTLGDLAIGEEQLAGSIATAARRQDQLELEEDTLRKGRISVAQRGDMPFAPSEDSRKKRAILGFVGGFGASFGLFFLLGCVDRRAYGSRQLRCEALPEAPGCLGVLPDLGHSLRDPESSDIAAHCVHQIRNQIETAREDRDGYVIAISSPYQGDGKTSIVMALGWSYAAAGFRTLLIDCDLVGRSLTRQLGMIGRAGLREMLHGTSLNGQVAALHVDQLSVLPVGVDDRVGPETIRRLDLARLFDQVRDQYDIIVVDTGPMLGSLESTPVTAAADGVVLSVRRGRSRTRLEECIVRLGAIGAQYLGVILNCASRNECDRYVSEASLVSVAAGSEGDSDSRSLAPTAEDEQNALMIAMEATSRPSQPGKE